MIRVADYIVQYLVKYGIKDVFMITGGGAMHLNDAVGRNPDINYICNHHEQASAIAAESYCRLTNKIAGLIVTSGPGGINALNGVYGAYVDSLGMIVISGQVKRETFAPNYPLSLRQLGDQEVDIVRIAKSIVKYATVLQEPNMVRVVLEKALFLTTFGRPGPVWIDVPIDVQSALIDPKILEGFDPISQLYKLATDPDLSPNAKAELEANSENDLDESIQKVIKRIIAAKRPVIFAGAGIRISGMHSHFVRLVEKLGIPVVTGWNAHDALTNDHPCYTGRPGTVGDRAGNFTVQNADVILVLGSRLNIRQVSYNWKSFAKNAWIAMVDIDAAELKKPTLHIDLPIHANLKDFLPKLLSKLRNYQIRSAHSQYLQWCRIRVEKYSTIEPSYWATETPINPYCFISKLFEQLLSEDIVVTGNGSACVVTFQAAILKQGQRLYTNSGCASMGYDIPAAIGACYGAGKRRVICLAGDGSIMMNIQELQTIVGNNLPIKVIVLNNNGYHSIRQTQQAYFPDNEVGVAPESGVTFPDFMKLGAAFGLHSIRCEKLSEINEKVREILGINGPALLEVMLDIHQSFSPKLVSRKLKDGTMVSPALEDMAPFLPMDELKSNIIGGES